MTNLIIKEYESFLLKYQEMKIQLSILPEGYISKKKSKEKLITIYKIE